MAMEMDRSSDDGINTSALWAGAALIGVGGLLCAAGAAIGVAVAYGAMRRWADRLDEAPSQIARRRWSQARAATSAGIDAWRNQTAHPVPASTRG
jgi:hypothetical protein